MRADTVKRTFRRVGKFFSKIARYWRRDVLLYSLDKPKRAHLFYMKFDVAASPTATFIV